MNQIDFTEHLEILPLTIYVNEVPAFDLFDEVALGLLQTRFRSSAVASREDWDSRLAVAYVEARDALEQEPMQS